MSKPRLVAALLTAVVSLSVTAGHAEAKATTGTLLLGASVTAATGQTAAAAFAGEESELGRGLAVDRSYSRWDAVQPSSQVTDDIAHGRTPLLSITAQRADGSKVSWASIATGAQDATIRAQAAGLRASAKPVILIFQHEADIAVGYGTAADFVAAYRHYVAVFRAAGATNVSFSFVLTPSAFADPSAWYPGDDVVDWIGTDAYNFAACAAGRPAWHSLASVAQAFYDWGSARGKPLMLAEWGSAEDATQPGRKASWITDAQATLASWPNVRVAAYFDRVGSCDWRLSTSASALAAFRDVAHAPASNGAPTARLLASVGVGPAPLYETFGAGTSTATASATGSGITSWTLDAGDGTAVLRGTGQPGLIKHNYAAGRWTARLTVTDATGASAGTTIAEVAAAAPVVSQGDPSDVSATAATVPGWVGTSYLAGSYYLQWGATTAYGSRTAAAPLAALGYTQAVTGRLTGLAPDARTHWRLVATTAAGTTYGPDRFFSTTS